jgi:autotransporter-associated beta strand protein
MAVNSQALAATTGNLTVGGGSLTVSNVSLVNQTAGTGTGNLYVGGTITCSGNITKTTLAGTGNITITNGTLTVASGKVVGTPDKPIDNISLTSATLNLSVLNNLTNIAASALNLVDAANTVNISALPSIGAFPTQIPIITYTSFPGAGSLNLVTLPGGFSGYVSNDTVNTLWLVITNGPFIAKADLWSGGVNNNWDTATLNWTNAGSAVTYNEGDFVTFDDSAKTNNVNLSGLRLPASLTVSNNALNYTFYGSGSIGGSVGLLKDGTGSLTLSETGGDNFTGGIVISNGTVILDNFGSAVSGGLTVNSGATAQIGNNSTNGVLPSGNVVVDGTLVFKRTNDLTVATVISGAGSLIKSASGKLTLSGVQAYTGGTIITNGTLALTGAGTISNSAQVVVSGATLDLTGASGQTILASLNLTNANLSVAMPNVTTPVNVTGLNMGGAGNTINVSALPTIAAYPVTVTLVQSASAISGFNASLGTLPAASPAFAGSVALSGDQLAVRLTLTSGPIGVRPAMFWSGGDAPNLNWSDGLNWLLPGAPTAADNVVFNNTATASASALTTPGGGSSALDPGNFNNIVDANFSVSSLTYTNLGGTYHNTHLANGRTLTMTNVMTVGAVDAGATTTQEGVTISGSTATVTVNNTNANVQVWLGSANVNHQATLDLSALDNFSANVSRLTVGASAVNNAVNRPSGILYLAKTNSISAGFQTTTIEAGTTTGNAGIVVADCNQNAGSASFLYLGNVNTISADTIAIARQKTTATLAFNPIYVNVAPFPTATLQGFTSSRISVFDVSSGAGNTGTTTGTGTADFSGGIVNALVDTLSVGRASTPASGNSAGTTTGVLTFDAGTINANTLNLGLQPAAFHNLKVGIGTLTVGTNSTIGVAAKLIVNSNLNLAVNAGNATTAGTLNINGGTVQAGNIVAGVNGATSTINLTEGTLIVTNTAGTPAAPLTTLNLNGGTVQLNLDGSSGVANVVATTVAVTATTTIKVGAIVNVAAATTYPLVSYAGSDPYASLILAPLPAGYAGNLVDDTANSLISLMITTAPAQPPVITSITLSGGSVVFSGNNGVANAPYHVLGSTNIALPLGSWSDVGSGTFDSSGNFSFTNAVGPGPQLFYILRTP